MRKDGFSFSLRRLLGLSALKQKVSKTIGIPLTRQARQRKLGRMVSRLFGFGRRTKR